MAYNEVFEKRTLTLNRRHNCSMTTYCGNQKSQKDHTYVTFLHVLLL